MEKQYWYDHNEAEKVVNFLEKLNLDKGKKGQKIKLLEFQKKIICDLLCWKSPDGTRRYREAFIFLPRKNGKSFLIACIFTYLLYCDKEYGAEYIIAANSRDQAANLFNTVKIMIQTNKTLLKHCRIVDSRKKIIRNATNSMLQVISSDASKADSFSVYVACVDETHEAKNRDLFDKLKTGMGTRGQPLLLQITTASSGQNEYNLEYSTYKYAKRIESGEIQNDTFYSAIFEANDDCDIMDEKQWHKANPALGKFRSYDELKSLAQQASDMANMENTFRRLYLNQHIRMSNEQAINMKKWHLCDGDVDLKFLKGRECWAGLDLSTRIDITAFVMVFPIDGEYYIVPHFFKPSESLLDHEKRDRVDYTTWAKQGLLHSTDGDYVHFRYVRQIINECAKDFDIQEIAFDRFGSQGIISDLQEDGFTVVDFGQGYRTMSPATKDFYELLFDGKIRHGNNKVLTWMAENVISVENASGDIKFDKSKSTKRIDGIIAMLMGLSRAVANQQHVDLNENITDEFLSNLGW
ncbi:terminase large subunit [Salipaludibacillus sp. CF4.18]|uniref:terminase large subunit n=1 Tax=Salipaludibacillus sp. CF4.18 TaxID=3373081 RepID=UPI003EE6A528